MRAPTHEQDRFDHLPRATDRVLSSSLAWYVEAIRKDPTFDSPRAVTLSARFGPAEESGPSSGRPGASVGDLTAGPTYAGTVSHDS